MLRRLVTAVITVTLALGATLALVGPAQAASPAVAIRTIPTQTVGWNDLVVVKPTVARSGPVVLGAARLTITQNGKPVATSKPSVTLKRGIYRVTTTVQYRIKKNGRLGSLQTKKKVQNLTVTKAAACATKSDYAKVKTYDMVFEDEISEEEVDSMASAAADMRSKGKGEFQITLIDLYDFAIDDRNYEAADGFAFLMEVYGEDGIWSERSYTLCKRSQRAYVSYVEDDAWFKMIE